MKITVTEHEKALIILALTETGTVIGMTLAAKINSQDTADDGAEVALLSVEPQGL